MVIYHQTQNLKTRQPGPLTRDSEVDPTKLQANAVSIGNAQFAFYKAYDWYAKDESDKSECDIMTSHAYYIVNHYTVKKGLNANGVGKEKDDVTTLNDQLNPMGHQQLQYHIPRGYYFPIPLNHTILCD